MNQRTDGWSSRPVVAVQEAVRRNPSALAMDLLFLFTLAFFAHHLTRGWWPAGIAALPLGALLYFGWHSSKPFFVVQLVVIAVTILISIAGWVPL